MVSALRTYWSLRLRGDLTKCVLGWLGWWWCGLGLATFLPLILYMRPINLPNKLIHQKREASPAPFVLEREKLHIFKPDMGVIEVTETIPTANVVGFDSPPPAVVRLDEPRRQANTGTFDSTQEVLRVR